MRRIAALGSVCILMTFVLIGLTVQLQKKLVFHEAEQHMGNLAGSVEMDLKRALFGIDQVFVGLENYLQLSRPLYAAQSPEVRKVLDDLVRHNEYLVGLNVIDATGTVIHANGHFVRPNLSERNFFAVHKTHPPDGLYISPPQQSQIIPGQWNTAISKGLHHPDGSLDMVIGGIVDLNYFFHTYRALFSDPDTSLTILSPDGLTYARIPDHDRFVGQPAPEADLHAAGGAQQGVRSLDKTTGETELVVMRQLEGFPLIVRVCRAEKAILQPWQDTARNLYLLGALLSLSLLFFILRARAAEQQKMATMQQLQIQSSVDPLTGLANRRHFLDAAQMEIKKAGRYGQPVSLIMVDLDHFKGVNDTFGHPIGDLVLQECARLLKGSCRETDLVGRFGGEEFLLLLPATDLQGALAIAEKIRALIADHRFSFPQCEVQITASLGVAQWHNRETSIDGALQRADSALYGVKTMGRNAVKSAPVHE
ncbi:MAG: sensor domain-containing diguanylate cyclase, partial [Pelovirga sp.]